MMVELQHTLAWHRARLGKWNGSQVGNLMVSGRGKDAIFGQSALSYIYQVAAERDMNPTMVENDDTFSTYLDQVNVYSKAMAWGTEMEDSARDLYATMKKCEVTLDGSVQHKTIPNFAASPDGLVITDSSRGGVEFKCPAMHTYMQYRAEVNSLEELKKVKPLYYWQLVAQSMCCELDWIDWVAYNPFSKHPIHIVHTEDFAEAQKLLEERIYLAEEVIDGIINQKPAKATKEPSVAS